MTGCNTADESTAQLRCDRCGHTNILALMATDESHIVECAKCQASIYWHRCMGCGLGYVGPASGGCPLCDGNPELDDLQVV